MKRITNQDLIFDVIWGVTLPQAQNATNLGIVVYTTDKTKGKTFTKNDIHNGQLVVEWDVLAELPDGEIKYKYSFQVADVDGNLQDLGGLQCTGLWKKG